MSSGGKIIRPKGHSTKYCFPIFSNLVGWVSVVCIVICYRLDGLDGSTFKPRFRQGFPHLSIPALGPIFLCSGYMVCFPGVKQLGHGIDHPPPYTTFTNSLYFMAHYAMNLPLHYI